MKVVLLIFALTCLGSKAYAQAYTYIPMPTANTLWEGNGTYCAQGNCWGANYRMAITGDTILNGLIYHKIPHVVYFREDSNKRVYAIRWGDLQTATEYPVYDFSLSIGDTLYTSSNDYYTIRSVDTVNYYGIIRRGLYVARKGSDYIIDKWLEGVGSQNIPFSTGIINPGLCVMYQDSIIVYGQPCDISTEIEGLHLGNKIIVYPNPAIDILNLSSDNYTLNELTVYNATGEVVLTSQISQTSSVNIAQLAPGIYIARVQTTEGIVTCRWVKI